MACVPVCRRAFWNIFSEVDADVFCIQESKLQEGQIDLELPGYHQYWNYAEKKGYSGHGDVYEAGAVVVCPTALAWRSTIRRDVSLRRSIRNYYVVTVLYAEFPE